MTNRTERAARAIRFLVPVCCPINLRKTREGFVNGWTDKGVREVKWPRDYSKAERKLIRAIARAALGGDERS